MSLSPAAHDPSVAEDGDTSPTELGRKVRKYPYVNALQGEASGMPPVLDCTSAWLQV